MRILLLLLATFALSGCRAPGSGFFSTERSRARATEEIRQMENQQRNQESLSTELLPDSSGAP